MFSKLNDVFNKFDTIKHEIYNNPDLIWCHCHGDIRPRNVIIKDSRAYLIDFELAHYGPRIIEICDGGFNHSVNIRTGDFSIDNFNEFINTYHRIYPFTAGEKKLLHKAIAYIGLLRFAKGCRGYDVSGRKSKIQTARALYTLLSQPENYQNIRIIS
jgi:Ser/Thr protein kinase RdoA (MazF antagonist)